MKNGRASVLARALHLSTLASRRTELISRERETERERESKSSERAKKIHRWALVGELGVVELIDQDRPASES